MTLLLLILGACGTSTGSSTGSSTGNSSTGSNPAIGAQSQPTATATSKPQPVTSAKLNQEIRYWTDARDVDVGVTPTSAKKSNGGQYDEPSAGHIFVVVQLAMKNYSTQEYDYSPSDFMVMDTSGNLMDEGYHSFVQHRLDIGTLAPGGTVIGEVVFEVPTDKLSGLKLAWRPTYDSPKSKYTWELGF